MEYQNSISVVVPTYNRVNYLEETLKAILAQDVQDLEIIVVDDCSTDQTKKFLINFAQAHPQIRPIFLTSNQGESSAVNAGWKEATKNFIAIVNSDDPPHKNWLKAMFQGVDGNPGYGFYYPNRLVINEVGEPLRYEKLEDWSNKTLYEVLIPIASAGLIINLSHLPISFVPRNPKVVFPSDLIQMLNLGLITSGIRIEGAWGVWREHRESFSSATSARTKAFLFETHVGDWIKSNLREIQSFGNPSLSHAYLYGHIWLIYRNRFGVFYSIFLMAKTSLFSSVLKRPKLLGSIYVLVWRHVLKRSL
jgi:glycosyltransferase involved in cell wall biosynthesis